MPHRPAAGGPASAWDRVRRLAGRAAVPWAVLQGTQLLLTFVDVVGGWPGSDALPQLLAFLDLDAGRALGAATLTTGLVAVAALLARGPGQVAVALGLAAVALLQLAGLGHAGGTAGTAASLLGLWLHTAAAGVWVGGLAVLVLGLGRDRGRVDLAAVTARYSTLAGWSFTVLALSGVLSLVVRVDGPNDVATSAWGLVVLTKAVLLGWLGVIGLAHRRLTLPLVARGRPHAFTRLTVGELLLMAAVMGMSTALARTEPPHLPSGYVSDPVDQLTGYAAPSPRPSSPS